MAAKFDIDAHGRVVPDDEARRQLADRAGRFDLLPASPDLFVARRIPAAGGAAPEPRCVLAGDLAAFPIGDLIAFMHQSRISGVLTVSAGGVDRAIAFKDGEVRNALSEAPGERLGEVAVRLGYVTEAQLAEAVAGARPIGKELVDLGFMDATELWKCMHEQVAAVFHAILLSGEGVFQLVNEKVVDRAGTPLAVNTQSLLMDGIRRIDEMSLFRAKIPDAKSYLRRREPRRALTLQPQETQLLELVDGRRTVAAVAAAAHLSEFDATKILYHLAEAGYVQAAAEPTLEGGPGAGAPALVERMNGIFREVAAEITAAGAAQPFLAGAKTFLADPASRFAGLWKGLAPAPDGTLDGALLARNAAASGASLREGLTEYMFFLLFQAGERLPREQDDALAARVKVKFEALEGL